MRKIHLFFCNLIAEINEELANTNSSFEREVLSLKLKEAWEMRLLSSEFIDWDSEDEEE